MQTIKVPTLNREAETVARHCEQRQLSFTQRKEIYRKYYVENATMKSLVQTYGIQRSIVKKVIGL
jgi:hypothetical protein